jgi:cytidyltransferase-like protein
LILSIAITQNKTQVYCDGVYDLCHIGHKLLFQNALQNGNRLYVGVVGDQDAEAYKRPPIMNHAERCAEVEACKAVTKVIPNSPCFGLTQEFLDEHQIHIVAYGEEYLERYPDPKDDPYYRVPRELGTFCGCGYGCYYCCCVEYGELVFQVTRFILKSDKTILTY